MYFNMFPGLFQAFSRIQNEIGDFTLVFSDLGHPKDVSQAISRPTLVRQGPLLLDRGPLFLRTLLVAQRAYPKVSTVADHPYKA